ncbi:hemerythrin domain-containing protein [Plantactinospora sp. KLBMP9567]|uniref:hemerythrin domain-containing protein n=1 Tax=Plantactinospora sp. KLBMP9567 TaxID=3085900 RepID=UPI002981638F|nr:hemerythrin domain-containing protein [Plantactinospora sp. KLBMP9567]MDW5327921.1 hemerythrin domain-containing protein [Plantactinospora sp. KLBMP9567]
MTAAGTDGATEGMDVVDLLLAQHARIEELFRTVASSDGTARRDAWQELVTLLAVHETAEEEIVHPLARGSIDAGNDVVDARLAEERQAKELLKDLVDDGIDAPDFDVRLSRLKTAVLEHATREERYEFVQLRAAQPARRLVALAAAVRAAEAVAPTRPHPGVESATANLLLGPPVAVVDAVRNAIRDATRD